jgi:hypothetical protein
MNTPVMKPDSLTFFPGLWQLGHAANGDLDATSGYFGSLNSSEKGDVFAAGSGLLDEALTYV